jgi:hypothetical protein
LAQTLRCRLWGDGIALKFDTVQVLTVIDVFLIGVAPKYWAVKCLNHGRRLNDLEAS